MRMMTMLKKSFLMSVFSSIFPSLLKLNSSVKLIELNYTPRKLGVNNNMATKKSGGTTKNGRDSNPKFLGIKVTPGAQAKTGSVLVRQRGTDVLPGKNVSMGKDHTLFAMKDGTVSLTYKRKVHFDNTIMKKKVMNVLPA